MDGARIADIMLPTQGVPMRFVICVVCLVALGFAGCAHPLETLAEQQHQARIDSSNANQPVSNGAGDGLGKSFAKTQVSLSLRAAMQEP
jgi:hypothetical protein